LNKQEVLAWADLRAATGHDDTPALYRRARAAMGDQAMPLTSLVAYANFLRQKGDGPGAAGVLDELVKRTGRDDPQFGRLLQWRAAVLASVCRQVSAPDADLRRRTAAALREVLDAPLPDDIRRDALRELVALEDADALPECLQLINTFDALVGADPYLNYVRTAGLWQDLNQQIAAGKVSDDDARDRAKAIGDALEDLAKTARDANDPSTQRRALLLTAQTLGQPPIRDARAALALLQANSSLLNSEPATKVSTAQLRVEMMLDLGMFDQAAVAINDVGVAAGDAGGAMAVLHLAETLAGRFDTAEAGRRGEVQTQVVALVNRALATTGLDPIQQATLALHAARALVAVNAAADAQAVIDPLLANDTVRKEQTIWLGLSLLKARALTIGAKHGEALSLLAELAGRFPKAYAVQLARGQCQMSMAQAQPAAESFRQARAQCKMGSDAWWQTTVNLCEALRAGGQSAAAVDILRVATALNPAPGDPVIGRDLIRIRAGLGMPATQPSQQP
jgi:tetratricopeptide (TPR) repeat protein